VDTRPGDEEMVGVEEKSEASMRVRKVASCCKYKPGEQVSVLALDNSYMHS